MKFNPFFILLKSSALLLNGRAKFSRERVGQTLITENGRQFKILREVKIKPKPHQPDLPNSVFRVWFRTKAAPQNTIRLSHLTTLGFLGMPGFRSKLWLYDDTRGEFGGIYEWDTIEDADNYDKSYAMQFSKWRSVPGKFRTEFFSQQEAPLVSISKQSG